MIGDSIFNRYYPILTANHFFQIFKWFVIGHWLLVSMFVFLGLLAAILHRKPNVSRLAKAKNVDVVIVSKASNSVRDVLFKTISDTCQMFRDHNIHVVVDEHSELNGNLEHHVKSFKNADLIVVPKNFKCKAIAKGRAIEYFIEKEVKPDRWYAFIDDDNRFLDDKFLQEITYFDAKGYVAANGILKPRMGSSEISFVADWLRYFDDLTLFKFCTGLSSMPLNGIHGELLIAKGNVLKAIGFDRKTLTEDFAFARELLRQKKKTWHSETVISILSPNSMMDFVRQRNRWYKGISRDVLSAPWPMKIFAGLRTLDWKLGIFGSWIAFPIWLFFGMPFWVNILCFVGMLYYWAAYIRGAWEVHKHITLSWPNMIGFIIGIPFLSLLEVLAPWYARLFKKGDTFYVIDKSEG